MYIDFALDIKAENTFVLNTFVGFNTLKKTPHVSKINQIPTFYVFAT